MVVVGELEAASPRPVEVIYSAPKALVGRKSRVVGACLPDSQLAPKPNMQAASAAGGAGSEAAVADQSQPLELPHHPSFH
jgi:hypothetical protein